MEPQPFFIQQNQMRSTYGSETDYRYSARRIEGAQGNHDSKGPKRRRQDTFQHRDADDGANFAGYNSAATLAYPQISGYKGVSTQLNAIIDDVPLDSFTLPSVYSSLDTSLLAQSGNTYQQDHDLVPNTFTASSHTLSPKSTDLQPLFDLRNRSTPPRHVESGDPNFLPYQDPFCFDGREELLWNDHSSILDFGGREGMKFNAVYPAELIQIRQMDDTRRQPAAA
jgi:hypothetical protein